MMQYIFGLFDVDDKMEPVDLLELPVNDLELALRAFQLKDVEYKNPGYTASLLQEVDNKLIKAEYGN